MTVVRVFVREPLPDVSSELGGLASLIVLAGVFEQDTAQEVAFCQGLLVFGNIGCNFSITSGKLGSRLHPENLQLSTMKRAISPKQLFPPFKRTETPCSQPLQGVNGYLRSYPHPKKSGDAREA